jgi:hypothetical protein
MSGKLPVLAALAAWRDYWDRDEGGTDEEAMAFALIAASGARTHLVLSGAPMSAEIAGDNAASNADVASLLTAVSDPQRKNGE